MTTADITPAKHFETFCARTAPAWLAEDAPPPANWSGTDGELESLRRSARSYHRQAASYRFLEQLELGWKPNELAVGALTGRAEIGLLDGSVRRQESVTPRHLSTHASALLASLSATPGARARIAPNLLADIETMATGSYGGTERSAFAALDAASLAISQAQDDAATERIAAEARPLIVVASTFRALGQEWQAGHYAVDPQDLARLNEWVARMEAQRDAHGWDWPAGFGPGSWPPFEKR